MTTRRNPSKDAMCAAAAATTFATIHQLAFMYAKSVGDPMTSERFLGETVLCAYIAARNDPELASWLQFAVMEEGRLNKMAESQAKKIRFLYEAMQQEIRETPDEDVPAVLEEFATAFSLKFSQRQGKGSMN
jgi:hypothetical protein